MSRLLLIDADDTCLNFLDTFQHWMFHEHNLPTVNFRSEKFQDMWGIGEDEITVLIQEFSESPEFRCLPPAYGAIQGIAKLRRAGHEIMCVTACHASELTKKMRRDNFDYVFGQGAITDFHFVGLHGSKREVFERYRDAVVIEDNHRHAVAAVETGHTAILFPHIHTGEIDPRLTVVQNWQEIVEVLSVV